MIDSWTHKLIRRMGTVTMGAGAVLLGSLAASQTQPSSPARTAAVAPASTGSAAGAPQAETPLQRAQQVYFQTLAAFLLNHDRAKAERGFLRVTQIDSNYAPAWFNLGVFAEGDKNWAEARGYFEQYLHIAPKGPDAERARKQLPLLAKYASGAITPAAAKLSEYDATIQRARAFLAAGLYREAIAEAGRAEAADATRWEAYAVVSLCMAKQSKRDQALKFEALAVNHAPAAKREQVRAALAGQIERGTQSKSGP